MATIQAAYGRLREQLRDYQQTAGQLFTGPVLLVIAVVLGIWALIAETDAFAIGVVTGSVLALGAIGLTLIYGVLKFAHFAHGDSMMLAAYIAFFALTGVIVGERTDTELLPWSLGDLPAATEPILDFSFGYGLTYQDTSYPSLDRIRCMALYETGESSSKPALFCKERSALQITGLPVLYLTCRIKCINY